MTAPRFVQQQPRKRKPREVFGEEGDAMNIGHYDESEEAMNRQQSEEARGRLFHDNYGKPGGIGAAIARLLAQKDNPLLGDLGRPDDMYPEHTAALSHVSPRDRIEQYGTNRAARDFDALDRVAAKLRAIRQRRF